MSHSQPTVPIALTTTFVPPATCTVGMLTMLPPPYYLIWANEPFPVANETHKDCYPSEFMASYKSVPSKTVGSSIVPAMSPLVCPKAYCPVYVGNNNYAACCPSGYKFTDPQTTVDANRPAYGGTCYSELTVSSTHTIVAYGTAGGSKTQQFIASVTDTHAYAHPIDGFAAQPLRVGECVGVSSSLSSSTSATSTSSPSPSTTTAPPPLTNSQTTSGAKLSTGSIAGAVIGGVVGLIAIIAIVLLILRSRKPRHQSAAINELSDTAYAPSRESNSTSSPIIEKENGRYYDVYGMRGVTQPEPIYEVDASERGMRGFDRVHEMNANSEVADLKNWPLHGAGGSENVGKPVDTKKM